MAKMVTMLLPPQSLQTCLWTMLASNQASQPPTLTGLWCWSAPQSSQPWPSQLPPRRSSRTQPRTTQKKSHWNGLGDKLASSSRKIIFPAWILSVTWFSRQLHKRVSQHRQGWPLQPPTGGPWNCGLPGWQLLLRHRNTPHAHAGDSRQEQVKQPLPQPRGKK